MLQLPLVLVLVSLLSAAHAGDRPSSKASRCRIEGAPASSTITRSGSTVYNQYTREECLAAGEAYFHSEVSFGVVEHHPIRSVDIQKDFMAELRWVRIFYRPESLNEQESKEESLAHFERKGAKSRLVSTKVIPVQDGWRCLFKGECEAP